MKRLTDEEIQNMTLAEIEAYTELYLDETWRFAKAYGVSVIKFAQKAVSHRFKTERPDADSS